MGIDPKDDEPKPVPGRVHGIDDKTVVSVAAGGMGNGACITDEGEAYVWGYGDVGQLGRGDDQADAATPERLKPTKAMAGKQFSAVSFGGQHAAVLCVDGGGGSPGASECATERS
jgi:regulator of chromosome condensation